VSWQAIAAGGSFTGEGDFEIPPEHSYDGEGIEGVVRAGMALPCMSSRIPALHAKFEAAGQGHVTQGLAALPEAEREAMIAQLEDIDPEHISLGPIDIRYGCMRDHHRRSSPAG
jgi:hypothetical protein